MAAGPKRAPRMRGRLESEPACDALLSAIPDMLFEIRRDGTFLGYKAPHEEQLYAPPKAFLGKKISNVMPREFASRAMRHVRAALKTSSLQVFEYKLPIGGALRDFEARMFPSGPDSVLAIVRDLTEVRAADNAVRRERDLAERYLDMAADIIVAIGRDGKVSLINKRGCELLGRARREIIGRDWFYNFVPADIRKQVKSVFCKLMAGRVKPVSHYENPVIARGGGKRMIAWKNTLLKGKDGRIAGTLSSGTDVTEEKKAEAERLELYKTKELDALRDEFFAMTAHELKTPLTPIKLESDMWLFGSYGGLSPDQKGSLEIIQRNAARLIKLIDDISTITKIEQKRFKYRFARMDLRGVLKDLYSDLKAQAAEKGICLKVETPKTPVNVRADKHRLAQVLGNLVANAMYATDRGGITISAASKGGNALVCVKDTGVGISPRDLKAVFDKFYRVTRPPVRRYAGAGLGLAIAKGIVQEHGGDIWCESRLGKGSAFYFTVPLIKRAATPTIRRQL